MKTLLCLLSGQHVPNLLSVHHFQPDRLVLVESEGMRKKHAARDFLEALRLGGRRFDDQHCDLLDLDDENSSEAVRGCLAELVQSRPDSEWIVNLTGGTKPMSIAAYEFFRDKPARLIYTPLNRPSRFLDFRGGQAEECAYRPTIQEFLAGYGFRFQTPLEKIVKEEEQVRFLPALAQLIARRCAAAPVLQLNSAWREDQVAQWRGKARKKGVQLEPGDVMVPDDEVREAICKTFQLTADENFPLRANNR